MYQTSSNIHTFDRFDLKFIRNCSLEFSSIGEQKHRLKHRSVGKGKEKKKGKEQQVLSSDNEHCSCRDHPPLLGPPARSHRVDLFALIVAIPSPEGKRERECDAGLTRKVEEAST